MKKQKNILIALSACTFLFVGCKKMREMDDPKVGLHLDEILNFSYENEQKEILADGSDRMFIYVDLDSNNVSPNMQVSYTTEQGSFVGGDESTDFKTITVRADGYKAKVILKGNNVVNERVGISATVGEYTIYDEVSFTRSYPEQVLNSVNKLFLAPDLSDKVLIDVLLAKTTGVVSEGTRVDFDVITTEGNPQINISPLFWSSSNQQAELMTISQDTGKIAVVPYVLNAGTKISSMDTINIFIQN
jgi:hypothetical protein